MKFRDYSVTQILIGLHRIGVVGLHEELRTAEEEGLEGREAIVDRVMEHLGRRNYIPDSLVSAYRIAVWREFLRRRGADISEFYSEVAVTVRGEPGEERDRFVELVGSVLAEFELKPIVTLEPPSGDGPSPQLRIGDDTIMRGMPTRQKLKLAVRQSISEW